MLLKKLQRRGRSPVGIYWGLQSSQQRRGNVGMQQEVKMHIPQAWKRVDLYFPATICGLKLQVLHLISGHNNLTVCLQGWRVQVTRTSTYRKLTKRQRENTCSTSTRMKYSPHFDLNLYPPRSHIITQQVKALPPHRGRRQWVPSLELMWGRRERTSFLEFSSDCRMM